MSELVDQSIMDFLLPYISALEKFVRLEYLSIGLTFLSGLLAVFGETWINRRLTPTGWSFIVVLVLGVMLKVADNYRKDHVRMQVYKLASSSIISSAQTMAITNTLVLSDSITTAHLNSIMENDRVLRADLHHFTTRYLNHLKVRSLRDIEKFLQSSRAIIRPLKDRNINLVGSIESYNSELQKLTRTFRALKKGKQN